MVIKINVFLKSIPRDSKLFYLCSKEQKLSVLSWGLRKSADFVCEEHKIHKPFKPPNRNTNRSELLRIYTRLNNLAFFFLNEELLLAQFPKVIIYQ